MTIIYPYVLIMRAHNVSAVHQAVHSEDSIPPESLYVFN